MRCGRRSTSLSVVRAAALRRRSGVKQTQYIICLLKIDLSVSFCCLSASNLVIQNYHKGAITIFEIEV